MDLLDQGNINAVLTNELLQFQLPATKIVSIPGGQPQGFPCIVLNRTVILTREFDNSFKDASWRVEAEESRRRVTSKQTAVGRLTRRLAIRLIED
jgi:hypothetical protein